MFLRAILFFAVALPEDYGSVPIFWLLNRTGKNLMITQKHFLLVLSARIHQIQVYYIIPLANLNTELRPLTEPASGNQQMQATPGIDFLLALRLSKVSRSSAMHREMYIWLHV